MCESQAASISWVVQMQQAGGVLPRHFLRHVELFTSNANSVTLIVVNIRKTTYKKQQKRI